MRKYLVTFKRRNDYMEWTDWFAIELYANNSQDADDAAYILVNLHEQKPLSTTVKEIT